MSPNNSPKSRRKASDTSRRTRSNINVEASPSSLKENLSEEKVDKSTIGPDKPRLVGSKVLRDQCNAATKRRNTGSHGRSPQIGLVKRLNSPKKSQAVSREVYPLRNQQLSRRTRQGSRRWLRRRFGLAIIGCVFCVIILATKLWYIWRQKGAGWIKIGEVWISTQCVKSAARRRRIIHNLDVTTNLFYFM